MAAILNIALKEYLKCDSLHPRDIITMMLLCIIKREKRHQPKQGYPSGKPPMATGLAILQPEIIKKYTLQPIYLQCRAKRYRWQGFVRKTIQID